MDNKLYHSHSFMFPVLRYSQGQVYPEYKVSFTFWNDTPENENFKIGEWILNRVLCPKEITPHRSIKHNELPEMKCGIVGHEGYPFKKCHDLWSDTPQEERIRFNAEHWAFGVQDYNTKITDIHVEDVVIGELNGIPYRQYKLTAEGYSQWSPCSIAISELAEHPDAPPQIIEYRVDAALLDNGDILFSASIHAINPDENQLKGKEDPIFIIGNDEKNPIGKSITVPCIPIDLTCTNYKLWKENDDFDKPYWNIEYQCSGIFPASRSDELPDEIVGELSYGLNGTTLRSVSGSLIDTRHSENIIGRKKVIAYSLNVEPVYTLGSECSGGVAMSDIAHKETKSCWQSTDRWDQDTGEEIFEVTELTLYRHEIEVLM